ncbi:MAG: hypothetical protein KDD85_08255, partial [Parvularculaceae bacterium]|nr:hypothetical protein [Parvularculaceae bacterium]
MAKKAEKEAPESEQSDGPILDLTDAEVKKLIKSAKARGYVTYDELNSILPSAEFSSEQIEDVMAQLSEMGINVVEDDDEEESEDAAASDDNEEAEESPTSRAVAKKEEKSVATGNTSSSADRTDDPVRMY